MFINAMVNAGVPFLLDTVKKMLLNSDNDVAKKAGKALGKVDTSFDDKTLKKALSEQDVQVIKTVNESLQKEVSNSDPFVRRMRPTFGYIMAITWFFQMMAVAYLMIWDSVKAVQIVKSFAELSMMWSVGLSVLGVYVYKRSTDKKQN